MKYNIILLLLTVVLLSCGKDQSATDEEIIADFIAENGLEGVQQTPEGIYFLITGAGNGENPKIDDNVTVHYRGYYTDGEEFDSSYARNSPATFSLLGVIPGWRIGIPKFSKGGSGTLIIPSAYGYGSNPPSGIRKDAVLVFDVELIDFE